MFKKLLTTFLTGSMLIQGMCLPVLANTASGPEENQNIEMYRLYNRSSGEHFYTADLNEKDTLVSLGWKYEGIGWYAPQSSKTPVYRLYNKNAGDHHYTTDKNEKDTLVNLGWNDEGISWYSDDSETIPLYRQYNPNAKAGSHNYTTSKAENDSLCSIGWKEEGIGWYALKEGQPASEIDYEEVYRPILNQVKWIVENREYYLSQPFQGFYDYPPELIGLCEAWTIDIVGYLIQDFSGDEIPELAIFIEPVDVIALYTIADNTPINVFYGYSAKRHLYTGENTFMYYAFAGNGVPRWAPMTGLGLFSLSKDGQNTIFSEYYYCEPYGPYSEPEVVYSSSGPDSFGSPIVEGNDFLEKKFEQLWNRVQEPVVNPLSQWN